jgi:hypothetical protein
MQICSFILIFDEVMGIIDYELRLCDDTLGLYFNKAIDTQVQGICKLFAGIRKAMTANYRRATGFRESLCKF